MSVLNLKVRALVADLVSGGMITPGCPLHRAVSDEDYRLARQMLREMARGENISEYSAVKMAPISSESLVRFMGKHGLRAKDLALFGVDMDTWEHVGLGLLGLLCVCGLLWCVPASGSQESILRQELEAVRAELAEVRNQVEGNFGLIRDENDKRFDEMRQRAAKADIARDEFMKHRVEVFIQNASQMQDAFLTRLEQDGRRVMDNLTTTANASAATMLGRLNAVVESANNSAATMLDQFSAVLDSAAQVVQNKTEAFGDSHANCLDEVDDLTNKTSLALVEWASLHDSITVGQDRLAAQGEEIGVMVKTLEKVREVMSAIEEEQYTLRAAIGHAINVFQTFNDIGGPYSLVVVAVLAISVAMAGHGYMMVTKSYLKAERYKEFQKLEPSTQLAAELQKRIALLEKEARDRTGARTQHVCDTMASGLSLNAWAKYCCLAVMLSCTIYAVVLGLSLIGIILKPAGWVAAALAFLM